MGSACGSLRGGGGTLEDTEISPEATILNGALPAAEEAAHQCLQRLSSNRASSTLQSCESGDRDSRVSIEKSREGSYTRSNPELDEYLGARTAAAYTRAVSRISTMSGTTVYEDALDELPDDAASREMLLQGASKGGAGQHVSVDTEGRQSGSSSPTGRSWGMSSFRSNFGRIPSKLHTVVAAPPEPLDLGAYDGALLALQQELMGGQPGTAADLALLPVAPWNRRPGYLGHLTAVQAAALGRMRALFPASAAFHTDHDLLRFLRARDFNLDATRAMYQAYISTYREKLLVSAAPVVRPVFGPWSPALAERLPQRPEHTTRSMQMMMDCYLHAMVFHRDKLGRPVLYLKTADMINLGMVDSVGLPDRIIMQTASLEMNRLLCIDASMAAGFHVEEIVQVIDLGGVSTLSLLAHQRSPENQAELQHNQNFNPETLGKVIIINAPFGSSSLWKLAAMLLPPSTRAKVAICSGGYKAELLKFIDADQLPSCYGGKAHFEWPKHQHQD